MSSRFALCLVLGAVGCDAEPPTAKPPPPRALASLTAPAPPPPRTAKGENPLTPPKPISTPVVSEEAARSTIAHLSEVARVKDPRLELEERPEPGCTQLSPSCFWQLRVGNVHFHVDATNGEVSVPMPTYDGGGLVPYRIWSARQKDRASALDVVLALPEIRAYSAALERDAQSLRIETLKSPDDGCSTGESTCRWTFDVRPDGDHALSWIVASVDAKTQIVHVSAFDVIDLSYEAWRTRVRKSRPWSVGVPNETGEGPLGYGAPGAVIDPVTAYRHAIKDALAKEGLTLTRVELYREKKYPVLFVRQGAGQLEGAAGRAAAARLLNANGGWPFELVLQPSGARLRFLDETDDGFIVRGPRGWPAR